MMMVEETDFFFSQDGLKLSYRSFLPENPTCILCIIHGLGEHAGRYSEFAETLSSAGVGTYIMDLRGHGLSQGKKGHAKRYGNVLSDIEELLKTARAAYTDHPIFLMGHSLGGNLVANYLIKMNTNELAGYILSSPWFKLSFSPPKWKVRAGNILAKIWSSFSQPNGLNPEYLSRDAQVVQDYINDSLVHDRLSAGFFTQITAASNLALGRSSEIDLQGLIYHGTGDRVTSHNTSKEFSEKVKNSEFHSLKGVFHEPHNDIEKDKVFSLLKKWMKKGLSDFSNSPSL